MKKIIVIAILFVFQTTFSQNNINNYKYIIVPTQYLFQKSENQYQINALTKFLFEKYGFKTYMSNEEYPSDLANNPCLALKGNVVNLKGLLSTKVKIELVDCNNKVVFSTSEAKTKEKEYKKAYNEAIRKAFVDIEEINYAYVPNNKNVKNEVAEKQDTNTSVKHEKDTLAITKIIKSTTVVSNNATNNDDKVIEDNLPVKAKVLPATIDGFYFIDNWGRSEVIRVGDSFVVKGGTEAFTYATIYPTSVPNYFIIKWVAYKEPKLVKLNTEGNLEIDSDEGVKIYKRDY